VTDRLAQVQAEVARHMDAIAALFRVGARVTVIVRTPEGEQTPGAQDFVMTADDLSRVIDVVERRAAAIAPLANRGRTVPPTIMAPIHDGSEKRSVVMTNSAIHTIRLAEGSFAAIVLSRPTSDVAAIAILDRAEVAAHIQLLRNAIDDADRLDRGEPTSHAAPSLRRN
jgi:hypothetical protein